MDINTLKLFGFLIFVFPGSIFWLLLAGFFLVKRDMKLEEIERDKIEIENRTKIHEELKKPFYRIRFITSDGNVNFSSGITPAWDDRRIRSKNWFWLNTAEMEANKLLKHSYERGFFRDSNDNTYPACNVLTAKIEVVSGT